MAQTSIEWATHVWNPFTGCDRVSPGCAHCYALEYAARLKAMGQAKYQNDGDPKTSGPGFGFTVHQDQLDNPPRFPAGARVFVNSMSDVFHEEAPDEGIAALFAACAAQPDVDFLILTKRAERMAEWVSRCAVIEAFITHTGRKPSKGGIIVAELPEQTWPLPNVWLGVSIENRRFVHRADLLRETPAAIRFISAEPLLGPLVCDGYEDDDFAPRRFWLDGYEGPELDFTDLDWLIVGGESGPNARRIDSQWVRDLHYESNRYEEVSFFFKQWGGRTPKAGGRELDGRTWDEMPLSRGETVGAA